MGKLFKAVSNRFRAKRDELAKRVGDPIADGRIAIADSKKEVRKYQDNLTELMVQLKGLQKQLKDYSDDVKKYQLIAEEALGLGNDSDARQAVELKLKSQERVDALKVEIKSTEKLLGRLRDELNRATMRIVEAENNLIQLEARMQGAKIRAGLAKAASSFKFDESGALGDLEDLKKSVEREELRTESIEEFSGQQVKVGGKILEERYDKQDEGSKVDEELDKIRIKIKCDPKKG